MQCNALTSNGHGSRCKRKAIDDQIFCKMHKQKYEEEKEVNREVNRELKDEEDHIFLEKISEFDKTTETGLDIILFDHQINSILQMEEWEKTKKKVINKNYILKSKIAILGDRVGCGKTLTCVSLIARDKMKWDLEKMYTKKFIEAKSSYVTEIFTYNLKKINTTLICASLSILKQWVNELKHSKLKSIIYNKNINPFDFDVVLVSDKQYNNIVKEYKDYAWKRFIFDEAGSIKIPSMKEINAGFTWLISSTYRELASLTSCTNTLTHIFKVFKKDIKRLENFVVKNDEAFINASLNNQIPKYKKILYKCKSNIVGIFRNVNDQTFIELLRAGDIESAIKHLGGSIEEDKNLTKLFVSKIEKEIKEQKDLIEKHKNESSNKIKQDIERWNNRIIELQKKKEDVEKRFETMLTEPCCICMEDKDGPVLVSCCQNTFCNKCLLEWIKNKNSCPLCRKKITVKDFTLIVQREGEEKKEEKEGREKKVEEKTKPEVLVDILLKEKGKFLIFSNHDESFKIIRRFMDEKKLQFKEVKGHKTTREKTLEEYKNGNLNILFLNSRFNGAGINLQCTTDIILYHEMSEHIEKQAIGRAVRLGQKNKVKIHCLTE